MSHTVSNADSLRVLQLMPSASESGRLTRLSLMDEELEALQMRGVELHTTTHKASEQITRGLRRHTIPRIRNAAHSMSSLWDCLRFWRVDSYASRALSDRFFIARSQRWIAQVAQDYQISLIHSHWARPSGTGGAAAKLMTGLPLVITLRGADVLTESSIGYGSSTDPWFAKRLRFGLHHADRILAISTAIANRAIEFGADPERTVVVHKGVDVDRFRPGGQRAARELLGLADRPTILFVGAFGPWKGLADLLDAFLTIHTRMKSAQLVLCGEGSLASDVRRFTKEHALEKDVVLPGHIGRDSLTSYYQACDVFVLPSFTEGAGNVLLEAAACGRPTVGTRAGGIPDYIVDGETGYLCEKRNAADLAEKIEKILRDPGLVDRLGKNGLARVREHFRYDQMVDKIIAAYTQVTERVS